MARLILVSNRLPVSIVKRKDKLRFQTSMGGLVSGLASFYKSYDCLWVGWPGISTERVKGNEKDIEERLKSENCYPVFLSKQHIDHFYSGFCNKTIWPLFHYFSQHTVYEKTLWNSYKKVNKLFCEAILKVLKPNDILWIHDYHFMLLPGLIREQVPEARICFFLHPRNRF